MKTHTIQQSELTSDCWLIQIQGVEACTSCEVKDTDECGGKEILKQVKAGTYPSEGKGKPIKEVV